MFSPKVSIIIPVYNWSNYLWEAIKSALAQTYNNIEILIINDGSNDNWETEKVAQSFGDKIKYFYKENWGVSTALNLGIKKMTWEYFSWLSHDDLYYQNKIEEQVKYLEKLDNKESIIFSDFEFVNWKWEYLYESNISKLTTENILFKSLVSSPINWCSLLINKKCFKKVWLFNDDLKTIQDYDMWFRLMKSYKYYFINSVLVKNRRHWEQDSNNKVLMTIKSKSWLNKKVLKLFTINEIKKSAWSKLHNVLFKPYLLFKLNILQTVSYLSIITRKLKIHTLLMPIARKIFFK